MTVSRRSSTGTIAKQKLTSKKSIETRRVHSGPTKRTSPQIEEKETRVKSSPSPRKYNAKDINNDLSSTGEIITQPTDNSSSPDESKRIFNVYKEHVRPILKQMDDNFNHEDSKSLCANCLTLSEMLYAENILPETEPVRSSNVKVQILKSLFSYLRLKDPLVHLRLAKIVLQV